MRYAKIQQLLLSNGFTNKHVCKTIIRNNRGTVFSVQSMPICYKQDSWRNELLVGRSPTSKNASTEAEDIVEIRHQAMTGADTTDRNDLVHTVVNCTMCKLVITL
jgi:hypothetical protein